MFNLLETECAPETFGHTCEKNCSKHCSNNQTCNHITGVCPDGCMDGFCGANCSLVCSENCTKCRNTDGCCIFTVEGTTSYVEGIILMFLVHGKYIPCDAERLKQPLATIRFNGDQNAY